MRSLSFYPLPSVLAFFDPDQAGFDFLFQAVRIAFDVDGGGVVQEPVLEGDRRHQWRGVGSRVVGQPRDDVLC